MDDNTGHVRVGKVRADQDRVGGKTLRVSYCTGRQSFRNPVRGKRWSEL